MAVANAQLTLLLWIFLYCQRVGAVLETSDIVDPLPDRSPRRHNGFGDAAPWQTGHSFIFGYILSDEVPF